MGQREHAANQDLTDFGDRAGLQKTGAGSCADRYRRIQREHQPPGEGCRWQDQSRSEPRWSVDRQIGLIRLERPDGTPIALVANYAIHGTVLSGRSEAISGDAPGVVSAYVEEKLGAPVLFVNGAAGNAAPIYSVYADPKSGHLGEFRVLLGDRILQANAGMKPGSSDARIQTGETMVETPLKPGLEWPASLRSYSSVDSNGNARASAGPISYKKRRRYGRRQWNCFPRSRWTFEINLRSSRRSTSVTPTVGSDISQPPQLLGKADTNRRHPCSPAPPKPI